MGVEAAFDAKVTVTGAFDDACASYFGGVVVTDNLKREMIKQMPLTEDLTVLFHVPPKKAYTVNSMLTDSKRLSPSWKLLSRRLWKVNLGSFNT